MNYRKELSDFTNKELSKIIFAFYICGECYMCPCDGVLCGLSNIAESRKQFALEVARRLREME